MKSAIPYLFLAGLMIVNGAERNSLDAAWKFARFGDMPDGSQLSEPSTGTPSSVHFDDSHWRTLDLPHDWGIEGPFRADLSNGTGKLPWHGIGWYRKTLVLPASCVSSRGENFFP